MRHPGNPDDNDNQRNKEVAKSHFCLLEDECLPLVQRLRFQDAGEFGVRKSAGAVLDVHGCGNPIPDPLVRNVNNKRVLTDLFDNSVSQLRLINE